MCKDVTRVAHQLGRAPTRAEYEPLGRFGAEVVRRRSQQKRWEDAVAVIADLDPEEVKLAQASGGKRYCMTAKRLDVLYAPAEKLGRAPTRSDANAAGINARSLCMRIRGGCADVLRAAWINPAKRSRLAVLQETLTEAMIGDVVRVAGRLGRKPTMRDMSPKSEV